MRGFGDFQSFAVFLIDFGQIWSIWSILITFDQSWIYISEQKGHNFGVPGYGECRPEKCSTKREKEKRKAEQQISFSFRKC